VVGLRRPLTAMVQEQVAGKHAAGDLADLVERQPARHRSGIDGFQAVEVGAPQVDPADSGKDAQARELVSVRALHSPGDRFVTSLVPVAARKGEPSMTTSAPAFWPAAWADPTFPRAINRGRPTSRHSEGPLQRRGTWSILSRGPQAAGRSFRPVPDRPPGRVASSARRHVAASRSAGCGRATGPATCAPQGAGKRVVIDLRHGRPRRTAGLEPEL